MSFNLFICWCVGFKNLLKAFRYWEIKINRIKLHIIKEWAWVTFKGTSEKEIDWFLGLKAVFST